jgi:hypothetical protein
MAAGLAPRLALRQAINPPAAVLISQCAKRRSLARLPVAAGKSTAPTRRISRFFSFGLGRIDDKDLEIHRMLALNEARQGFFDDC